MADELTNNHGYRFGEFILDTRTRELARVEGAAIPITSKAFDALYYLVKHRDRVVAKDELLSAIWPGRVVEENNLNQAISALRHALGSGGKDRRFIVTVPGKGYRFVADVVELKKDAQPELVLTSKTDDGETVVLKERSKWKLGLLALIVLVAVAAWPIRYWLTFSPDSPKTDKSNYTLTIVPFRALNGDTSDPLLEVGLADTLIARLSQYQQLHVSSLAAVLSAGKDADPIATGRRLHADYLIDGSTQRFNDHVRVNVRLVEISSGNTIWVNTFDEPMDRVFHLQDGVARAVAQALKFSGEIAGRDVRSPCEGENIEAYRALLTGRYFTAWPVAERLTNTLRAYRRAIELDPSCASAYAGIAVIYRAEAISGTRDSRELMPLSLAALEQALALDPYSAEAYVQLGFFRLWYDRDWPAAEAAFVRAIDLKPDLADAHFGYAHLLIFFNRFDEALFHIDRARELDPLRPLINVIHAGMIDMVGQEEAALQSLQRSFELTPDFWLSLYVRAGIMLDRGVPAAAVADLENAAERSGGNNQVLGMLAMAYGAAGNLHAAKEVVSALNKRASESYVPPSALAAAYLGIGETDKALELLEQAYEQHDVRIAYLGMDARWNAIRAHPRFRELLNQLGFSPEPARGRF
jgi:DNA-binding winged helix-turn-helix (wHTH) protein/TolB-like protein/Tfp pilus assembly protein PilF